MLLFFRYIGWFICLLLLQVLIFNHIYIATYATAFVYLYFLLILPSNTNKSYLLLLGFTLGLLFDLFSNTLGVATSIFTFLAFIRPTILQLFISDEDKDEIIYPSKKSLGKWGYFLYIFIFTFLHNLLFFNLIFLTFNHPLDLIYYILGSTFFTLLVIYAIDSIRNIFHFT